MLLLVDNYDSFTFNLAQYFQELGAEVVVRKNDSIDAEDVVRMRPDRVVISPGPKAPSDTGVSAQIVRQFAGVLPILGVCLGHQTLGWAMGGSIVRARRQMHGKMSTITNDGKGVYAELPRQFSVVRYHSLVIDPALLPDCLEVTSMCEEGEIMGIRHRASASDSQFAPLEGVQFHPESILTQHGHALLRNFLLM